MKNNGITIFTDTLQHIFGLDEKTISTILTDVNSYGGGVSSVARYVSNDLDKLALNKVITAIASARSDDVYDELSDDGPNDVPDEISDEPPLKETTFFKIKSILEAEGDVERDPSGAIIDDAKAMANFKMRRKKLSALGPEKLAQKELMMKKRAISGMEDPEDKRDQQNIMRLDMQRNKIVNKIRDREGNNEMMR